MIQTNVFHVSGQSFVEPNIIPPGRSDQITKPLKQSKIMDTPKQKSKFRRKMIYFEPIHESQEKAVRVQMRPEKKNV